MNGDRLLDTNIVVALFASDAAVLGRLGAAGSLFLSTVTVGELHYGARRSNRVAANIARIEQFLATIAVLDTDVLVADQYGRIKNDLRAIGRPIPENDIWIAATARQHGLTLVTRDGHFQHIAGLALEAW